MTRIGNCLLSEGIIPRLIYLESNESIREFVRKCKLEGQDCCLRLFEEYKCVSREAIRVQLGSIMPRSLVKDEMWTRWNKKQDIHLFRFLWDEPSITHIETKPKAMLDPFAVTATHLPSAGLLPHSTTQQQTPSSNPGSAIQNYTYTVYVNSSTFHSNAGSSTISYSGDNQSIDRTSTTRCSPRPHPKAQEARFIIPQKGSAAVPIRHPQPNADQHKASNDNIGTSKSLHVDTLLLGKDQEQIRSQHYQIAAHSAATAASGDSNMPLSNRNQQKMSKQLKRSAYETDGSSGYDSKSPACSASSSTIFIDASIKDNFGGTLKSEGYDTANASNLDATIATLAVKKPVTSRPNNELCAPDDNTSLVAGHCQELPGDQCSASLPQSLIRPGYKECHAIPHLGGASERHTAALWEDLDRFGSHKAPQPNAGIDAPIGLRQTPAVTQTRTGSTTSLKRLITAPDEKDLTYRNLLESLLSNPDVPEKAQARLHRLRSAADLGQISQSEIEQSFVDDDQEQHPRDPAGKNDHLLSKDESTPEQSLRLAISYANSDNAPGSPRTDAISRRLRPQRPPELVHAVEAEALDNKEVNSGEPSPETTLVDSPQQLDAAPKEDEPFSSLGTGVTGAFGPSYNEQSQVPLWGHHPEGVNFHGVNFPGLNNAGLIASSTDMLPYTWNPSATAAVQGNATTVQHNPAPQQGNCLEANRLLHPRLLNSYERRHYGTLEETIEKMRHPDWTQDARRRVGSSSDRRPPGNYMFMHKPTAETKYSRMYDSLARNYGYSNTDNARDLYWDAEGRPKGELNLGGLGH
ncbi:MAG: hypothetical protein Q9201_001109 [Fulgogasparrea decipioides]